MTGLCLGCAALRLDAGEPFEEALERARRDSSYVVLVLDDAAPAKSSWAEEAFQLEDARALQPNVLVVLPAASHAATAARFSASELPQTLLLDADGCVLGRLLGRQSPTRWARQLVAMLRVARHARDLLARPAETLDVESLFCLGMYRWNRGERGLAAVFFELVRKRCKEDAVRGLDAGTEAAELLAQYHLDLGRCDEAETLARAALAAATTADGRCRPTLLVAMSLRGQGKVQQAVDLLRGSANELRSSPGYDELLYTLGYLQLELGDRQAARQSFESCAESFPQTLHGQRAAWHCGLVARRAAQEASARALPQAKLP